jgi:hypothetical protein
MRRYESLFRPAENLEADLLLYAASKAASKAAVGNLASFQV